MAMVKVYVKERDKNNIKPLPDLKTLEVAKIISEGEFKDNIVIRLPSGHIWNMSKADPSFNKTYQDSTMVELFPSGTIIELEVV